MDAVSEIKNFIFSELAYDYPKDTVSLEDDLLSQGIIDSMGIIQLVNFMETKFGIIICPEDIIPENFHSLQALKEFIEKKQKK